MEVIFVLVWIALPIVLGVLLIKKRKEYKILSSDYEKKYKLLSTDYEKLEKEYSPIIDIEKVAERKKSIK